MTYRQEMGRIARAVAQLLEERGTVPTEDLSAALAGHSALVGLLRSVQRSCANKHPLDVFRSVHQPAPSVVQHAGAAILVWKQALLHAKEQAIDCERHGGNHN